MLARGRGRERGEGRGVLTDATDDIRLGGKGIHVPAEELLAAGGPSIVARVSRGAGVAAAVRHVAVGRRALVVGLEGRRGVRGQGALGEDREARVEASTPKVGAHWLGDV